MLAQKFDKIIHLFWCLLAKSIVEDFVKKIVAFLSNLNFTTYFALL